MGVGIVLTQLLEGSHPVVVVVVAPFLTVLAARAHEKERRRSHHRCCRGEIKTDREGPEEKVRTSTKGHGILHAAILYPG